MESQLETNQLLQAILEELRAARQPLGFGHPPKARTIYANRQYPSCLWYFWNGARSEPEPIEFQALTGIVERLEIEQKEYKGRPDWKVNLHIQADRRYVIRSGLETQFTKGLLYMLSKLPVSALAQPITIAVEPGETDQVLFCRLYNPETGKAVYAPYSENTDWQEVTRRAVTKIDMAHGRVPTPQSADIEKTIA